MFEMGSFKGLQRIDKEQLPQNVQALCQALDAKLTLVHTDGHAVIDITVKSGLYMDIVSDSVHFRDYDMQTLHTYFQRRLLETLYPEKELVFLGAFEEEGKIDQLQENFGNQKDRLKFFAAHDGHFGVAAWLVR